MQEETTNEAAAAPPAPASELARPVAEALASGLTAHVRSLVEALEAPDQADLIEPRSASIRWSRRQAHLSPGCSRNDETGASSLCRRSQRSLLAAAEAPRPTTRAYLLENIAEPVRQKSGEMPSGDRAALERNLEYPQDTAGRLMQTDFVAVPPFWTVGQVIDHMREAEHLPETFSDIYVVDATYHVLGSVDLSRLLRTKRQVRIDATMDAGRKVVLATADQEEVARQFERYDLKSAPVVDADKRLVGVVTVDDVVEVIEGEADEDLRRLAGIGDERITDSVRQIVPAAGGCSSTC
jgi:magnesium transporter